MDRRRTKRKTGACTIGFLVTFALLAGCLSSPDPEPLPDEGPRYEKRVTNESVEGPSLASGTSAWIGGPAEAWLVAQNHLFERPEHLHEARFVFNWTALSEGVFDEAKLRVTGTNPPVQATGAAPLSFSIDADTWGQEIIGITPQPWSSSQMVALQVHWEYTFEITYVEHVPIESEETEAEPDHPRGSNE